jgi:hypothetical protein
VVKTFIQQTDTEGWYSYDGSKPIVVFEFNLFAQGSYTKRIAYSIIDVFIEIGGLSAGIISFTMLSSNLLTFDTNNIQIIKMFKLNDGKVFNAKF